MFIAHLPAGYLLSRQIAKSHPAKGALIATGLLASVLPDTDLFWFYLVSDRQSLHHGYMFHWPLFWGLIAALSWGFARALGAHGAGSFILVALANLLLHLALDSVAAGVGWLRPLSTIEVNLVEVPARYNWWVWNFVLHWTFGLELAIILAAGLTLRRDLLRRRPATP
ncbi:metal-dependent hydrolase (plasmid) [Rhodobacter capsulatus]|uniref:metal-dependent hydrolase n=1 Tax=Rhodobacter capsulatus TaxID=1061 RepID=UPI0003D29F0A|nr:metal-dependent hydrolase [Rhodobacter capsulatus]ETD90981.1 hypothetical protein U713_03720 [Rhodobacter capsulatus YW2]